MKSAHICIVVFFRLIAVCVILYGFFFTIATPFVLGAFGGSLGRLVDMLFRSLVLYLGSGLVLWFLSRPIAGLILRGLDRE